MENPFFRNYMNSYRPRYSQNNGEKIPIHHSMKSPSRKVVSIPVHFVESEKSRSLAALKIQKFFRGFTVRKIVKKIIGIKREVDSIESRITETVDLIRKNDKERLKVNEMLMALLFKLDSVRGVDSGVRDARKAVIKKVIMLQERVDSIVAGNQNDDQMLCEDAKDQSSDVVNEGEAKDEALEIKDPADSSVEQTFEFQESMNSPLESETLEREEVAKQSSESEIAVEKNIEKEEQSECFVEESGEKECEEKQEEEEAMEIQQKEQIEGKEENRESSNVLMERMVEKNEKLVDLVRELCERNAVQTQLINSLSERMDNLERAYRSKRLRKHKKKRHCSELGYF